MMRSLIVGGLAALALSACAEDRLTPAPGEHPGWPQPSPPRATDSFPLPFTTQYTVGGQVQASPPARPDGNIPFGVRGETPPAPIPQPAETEPQRR